MLYSDKVILMNMMKDSENRPVVKNAMSVYADRCGITVNDVKTWINDSYNLPQIYYQDYCDQIDVDEWSDKTSIFDKDGSHVADDQFREGDILDLVEMPFDKDGRHASGYAIWKQSAAGNYCWINEYEED